MFAQPPTKKGKATRSKKPRTSKASSRLSTQSVITTTSEAPEIEVDDSVNQSIMSQATVKPKSTKKGSKSKGKSSKSKKESAEVESQTNVDEIEDAQPEPSKPKRTARSKKRTSEDIDHDEPQPVTSERREQSPAEPPNKRRATRTRSSIISQAPKHDHIDDEMPDAAVCQLQEEEGPRKGLKGTKKGTSTTSRKVSDVSVASKAASKDRVPRESDIEAELESELEAAVAEPGETNAEIEHAPEPEPKPMPTKSRASKKVKNGKKSKAISKVSSPPAENAMNQEDTTEDVREIEMQSPAKAEEMEPTPPKPTKTSRRKGTKRSNKEESRKAMRSSAQEPSMAQSIADDRTEFENQESFVSVEIINQEPDTQSEPEELAERSALKQLKKKEEKAKKSKKSKKPERFHSSKPVVQVESALEGIQSVELEPQPVVPETLKSEPAEDPSSKQEIAEKQERDPQSESEDDNFETPDSISDQVDMLAPPQVSPPGLQQAKQRTPVPPKTTKRYSDIPQDEHLAESFTGSQGPHGGDSRQVTWSLNNAISQLPIAHQTTPSLSPQSSDAENRPPSSRPSTSRAVPPSVAKEQNGRTPLAVSTPSPNKRNFNGGFVASAHPWTPVDIDEALYGEASDKENADLAGLFNGIKGGLTSPEKKMTVEEWIMWNAKSGEERLKRECERLVGQFEKEGGRAMQRLEAIECID